MNSLLQLIALPSVVAAGSITVLAMQSSSIRSDEVIRGRNDSREMPKKIDGPVEPKNFDILREDLIENGVSHQGEKGFDFDAELVRYLEASNADDLAGIVEWDPGFEWALTNGYLRPPSEEWAEHKILKQAFRLLVERSPARGFQLLLDSGISTASSGTQMIVRHGFADWAKVDIDAAWRFLGENRKGFRLMGSKRNRLLSSFAEIDAAAAIAAAERYGVLDDAMPSIAASLRNREDREAFFVALEGLPDSDRRRQEYIEKFVTNINVTFGFDAAARFLDDEVPGSSVSNGVALSLAVKELWSRPLQKWQWLEESSTPEFLAENARVFARAWTDEDFRACGEWVAGLPDSVEWKEGVQQAYSQQCASAGVSLR